MLQAPSLARGDDPMSLDVRDDTSIDTSMYTGQKLVLETFDAFHALARSHPGRNQLELTQFV